MEDLNVILSYYFNNVTDFEYTQIYSSAYTVSHQNKNYILKTGTDCASAKQNVIVIRQLQMHQIPVAEIIKTSQGEDLLILNDRYYLLCNKIEGEHIINVFENNYQEIAKICGEIVARLHLAFRNIEPQIECKNNDLLTELDGWIKTYFEKNLYPFVAKQDFDHTLNQLSTLYSHLPKQLIHRDLHFGNLLFENLTLSGYIDFDLSQINIRIFDLCYFLIGLLIDQIHRPEVIEKWFDFVRIFVLEYSKILPLQTQEKEAAAIVMQSIELLFVAFFGGMNNTELAKGAADLYYYLLTNQTQIMACFLC